VANDAARRRDDGKRERLVDAACALAFRQGVERTTLAEIAAEADVALGNVYYYFKTKDEIVAAVVKARLDELQGAFAALEGAHRTPKARLKGLIRFVATEASSIAEFGCQYGTLCTDLVKRAGGPDPHAARLMGALLDWAETQFRAMGRRDAPDLAVQFVAAYQGTAVVTNALGRPEVMARQARRIERWLDTIDNDPKGDAR
jgi:AcrR family transcriptional regulator